MLVMTGSESALFCTFIQEYLRYSAFLEFYEAPENSWEAAEEPEDEDKDPPKLSAEDIHDHDEVIVLKELPDSDGERVVEEENVQEVVLKEICDSEESILNCGGNEVSDELAAEIVDTPRPRKEPFFELDTDASDQNVPSRDISNLPVVNNEAKYFQLKKLSTPIRWKSNSYSLSSRKHCIPSANFLSSNHVLHIRHSLGLTIILSVSTLMLIPPCGAHDSVVIQNGSKSYECMYEGAITFQWKFNSSIISGFDAGVDVYNLPPFGFLILNPIPLEWNNTRIQCWAHLAGDSNILVFQDILYVQGVPAPVYSMTRSLKRGILNVFWVPSFKLDLMNDFTTFCVKLYNHATDDFQGIECNIEAHNYTISSDLKNLSCGGYSVQVIAQNIVGNSAPSSLRIWNEELRISDIVVTALNNHTGFKMVQFFMVMDICFSHTKLWFGNSSLQTADYNQSDIFQCLLDGDRMFEVFLEFNNLQLHSNSSKLLISTFDIIETIINPIHEGKYLIKSSFVANSNARGVLYAIMFIDDYGNEDYSRSLYLHASLEIAMRGIERSIPDGRYRLLSYDIDSNNLLHTSNSPANISMIVVTNSNYDEKMSNKGNCTLQQSRKTVHFSCNCSEKHLYRIILQKKGTNVIESYILSCLKELTMNWSVGQYQIIVFRENGTNLVDDISPYYTKVFTLEDTNNNATAVDILKSNSKLIGISVTSVTLVMIIGAVIVLSTLVILIMKRIRLQNTESFYEVSMKYTQNQEPTIALNIKGNKGDYKVESGHHGNDREKNSEDEDLDNKFIEPVCESSMNMRYKSYCNESTHNMPGCATYRDITETKYSAVFSCSKPVSFCGTNDTNGDHCISEANEKCNLSFT